jgi:hypothetical protein
VNPRRFVIGFLLASLLPTLAVGIFVWRMDPYQHFRASDRYLFNMRYMAAGLAKNQDYETAIVGDSMSQNFVASYASQVLGEKVVNLSISGSANYTLGRLARTAIRSGHARHIIWGLRANMAKGKPTRTRLGKNFPHYLYDANPFNDVRYLFNLDVLKKSWAFASNDRIGHLREPELFNTWFARPGSEPGRDKVLAQFKPGKGVSHKVSKALSADTLITNFDANVLSVVIDHPEVHFTFFVPPHPALLYADTYQHRPARFQALMTYLHHSFDQLTRLPNVTLHYFDTIPSITHNLNNYKDMTHYSVQVSNTMLTAFKQGQGVLTQDNYAEALDRFQRMVSQIDSDAYAIPAAVSATGR